jgi:hypothetical protein
MSWLRQSVTDLAPLRPEFDSMPLNVGLVVDRVALERVFWRLCVVRLSPVSVIPHNLHRITIWCLQIKQHCLEYRREPNIKAVSSVFRGLHKQRHRTEPDNTQCKPKVLTRHQIVIATVFVLWMWATEVYPTTFHWQCYSCSNVRCIAWHKVSNTLDTSSRIPTKYL